MARAQTTNGKTSTPDTSDLAAQIETLKTDLANLTSMIGEIGTAQSERAKGAIQDKLEGARETGAARVADAKDQAAKLGAEANDFVVRQPATALGIAAGIGFLIGMLGARR
ncbi:DUF883 domain-containing protein [Aestuariivita sp.]|jgi:ElaB/YqjD/DUF883 family membrane-anchored ribosome-binding protein|uniref:DUF883 family protein n=1 Tax=Aestuariivita sp. TaxID=1872407 RepID=UPI0021735B78|nr:DUF883 domain-containing protein [Aestuariivita sp.]MCE8006131.1 DUF883 domain-containing protein [Aestuariivita sp.]